MIWLLKEHVKMFNLSGIYVVEVKCSVLENSTKQRTLIKCQVVQNIMAAVLFTLFHSVSLQIGQK